MQIFYFLLLPFLFGQHDPPVPAGLAGGDALSGILVAPLCSLIAIPRHAGGELKRNFFWEGVGWVEGWGWLWGWWGLGGAAVCHRARDPSDHRGQVGVCQALRQTVCPCVPGESSASLHSDQELTFCLFAAAQRRNAGSPLGPLFWGVYSPCRSAAGLEPATLSDGRVDPGGMENAASRE